MEDQRESEQHLPSLFALVAPFISILSTSVPTHTPSHPLHTIYPTHLSPEGHGEPHTHHHQSDASIFWTKTGEEIPPNLSEIQQSQTVAALTFNTPTPPCLYPNASLQFTITPHTGSSPAFLSTPPTSFSLFTIQPLITCPPRFDARTPQRWYQVPVSDWISINSSS